MSKKGKNPETPVATKENIALGNALRAKQQRENALDIITIRSRKDEPTVPLSEVIAEHNRLVREGR